MRRLTSDGGTFDSSKKIPEHYSFDRKMVVGKSRILYSLNNMIRVKANTCLRRIAQNEWSLECIGVCGRRYVERMMVNFFEGTLYAK